MADYSQLLDEAGRYYNVDPALLAAQMHHESRGNPNAVSEKGAVGLIQLMPEIQKAYGITNARDPRQNIFGAARLMSENLDRYGNVRDAVLAYHGGTKQENWGPRTRGYADNVLSTYSGGAPVAASKPAQKAPDLEDFAAMDFAAPSAVAVVAPQEDFALIDFAAPTPAANQAQAAPQTPEIAVQAPIQVPQQADTPAQGIADRLSGIGDAFMNLPVPKALGEMRTGAMHGVADVLDAPAEWLAAGLDKSGLTQALANRGIDIGTYDQQVQANKDRRAAYEAQYGDSLSAGAGRLGGNVVGTMAPIGGAQAALARGGNALLGAVRGTPMIAGAAPGLQAAGNFLAGNAGLASRATNLAAQGAAGGALLSGGSDVPLSEQALTGAALGAAIPVAGAGLRAGYNTAKSLVQPFSESGQAAIANNTLIRQAGAGPTAADLTTYVPGSTPTLAQATKNPMLAAMERSAESSAPLEFGAVREANNVARMAHLEGIRGNQATLAQAIADRDAQALPLLTQAMTGARAANPTPVLKTIDDILDSHQGQRNAVVSAMEQVRGKIEPGGKATITDPDQLYGIRKSINDQLEVVSGRDNTAAQQASRELIQVRDALDGVIEKAAPKFKEYLAKYAELSKPVNAQTYLQSLNLTDAAGERITMPRVKAEIDRINKLRRAPGANDAKSITDDQLDALKALHKDLVRESYSNTLGKSAGSNTMQNLAMANTMQSALPGPLGRLPLGPESLGGALGYAVGGGPGAAYGAGAGNLLRQAMAAQNPEIQAQLVRQLVDPTTVLSRPNSLAENLLLQQLGTSAGNSLRATGDGRGNGR